MDGIGREGAVGDGSQKVGLSIEMEVLSVNSERHGGILYGDKTGENPEILPNFGGEDSPLKLGGGKVSFPPCLSHVGKRKPWAC